MEKAETDQINSELLGEKSPTMPSGILLLLGLVIVVLVVVALGWWLWQLWQDGVFSFTPNV